MSSAPYRIPKSLQESPLYSQHKEEIVPDAKRFDDVIFGTTWSIAKDSDDFPIDEKTGIQIAKSKKTTDTPALTIYFKVQGEIIVLLDVEISKDNEDL